MITDKIGARVCSILIDFDHDLFVDMLPKMLLQVASHGSLVVTSWKRAGELRFYSALVLLVLAQAVHSAVRLVAIVAMVLLRTEVAEVNT